MGGGPTAPGAASPITRRFRVRGATGRRSHFKDAHAPDGLHSWYAPATAARHPHAAAATAPPRAPPTNATTRGREPLDDRGLCNAGVPAAQGRKRPQRSNTHELVLGVSPRRGLARAERQVVARRQF